MSFWLRRAFFVCAVFLLGYWVTWKSKSFPQQSITMSSASREPSAIRKSYDFSSLDGMELSQASRKRLLADVKIMKENTDVGVELGHFVVRGSDGDKAFACQRFGKVVLAFEGDGMAVGGEKPRMEVEGDCIVASDINRIAPLWIPVSKILGEPVAEGEFDFRDPKPVKIRFFSVLDQWPRTWVLKKVTLLSGQGEQIEVQPSDLKEIQGRPVILEF